MTVRPTNDPISSIASTGPVRPDGARLQEAEARPAAPASPADGGDRVEISAQARAQAPARTEPLDLEVARTALRAGAKMDPARLHELRERVRTGYYDYPEAVDRIAEAVVRDLVDG